MSLRVLYSLCLWTLYIQQLQAGESILQSAECSELFEQSVENPNDKTTSWSNNVGSLSRSSCSICNARDSAKSWLVLKALPNNGYSVIHVSMQMKVSDCNICKDQSIKAFIVHVSVGKNLQSYKLLEDLPLVKIFSNKEQNVVKTADFKYALKGRKQFAVVLLSAGSCTEIKRITISYYVCEKNTSTAMVLPRTIAPENDHQQVNTSCSPNTINPGNKQPYGLCSSEGEWTIVSQCMCKEGYTLDSLGGCKECEKKTYKDKAGNERCLPCPKNSISNDNQQRCTCEENHFRFIGENYTSPCYGIPTSVNELQYIDKDHESVTLLWKPPTLYESLSSKIVIYEVDCFECSSSSKSAPCIKACGPSVKFIPSKTDIESENVTIKDLKSNTEYEFVIYSKNEYNGNISRSHWARASKKLKTDERERVASKSSDLPSFVVIVVPIIGLLMVVIIIILVICLCKRRKTRKYRASMRLHGGDIPLVRSERNYIDPTTYDNPERAVLEFTKELDRSCISFESIIGGGEFGDVYKGSLKVPGQKTTVVAIKTLKTGAKHKNRTDFLIEASVMGQFKNLNVISLEGVVTQSSPMLIVTEFMEHGSLEKYLKINDGVLKITQLLGMARGVASGMDYLAGMHYVHRDLAARNILVNANLTCKVADFGLSRDIKNEDSEYETQGGKIPVRWTAPEAIRYRKFSTASDVWSYGILLWEIMSFAERPYWNWGNEEVMKRVDQGYRLPAPMNCPKAVHQLMKECWISDRTKRPPFNELVRILDDWLTFPEKLNEDYIKVRRNDTLDHTTFKSVKDWLEAIKMGMYASNFTKAGYEEFADIARLTEDELLQKVGVRLVGHRHKIYQRIKEMSDVLETNREESVKI